MIELCDSANSLGSGISVREYAQATRPATTRTPTTNSPARTRRTFFQRGRFDAARRRPPADRPEGRWAARLGLMRPSCRLIALRLGSDDDSRSGLRVSNRRRYSLHAISPRYI